MPLDRVLATVNRKAILLSQLRPEFLARVAGIEGAEGRRRLAYDERKSIMMRLLDEDIEEAKRTEAAKTLGNHSPMEIQAWLERYQKAEMERHIKRWGSLNKFRRELDKFGTSAFALEEEVRTRALKQLAVQDMFRHMGDQQALLVTPKEMYKLWKKVRPRRRRAPGTVVSMVTLGRGTGPKRPELARKLATEWARSDASAAEMAAKYGGTALPDKRVTGAANDPSLPWIREFAASAKADDVSAPMARRDGSLWVLKAVQKDPGDDYAFADPAVQRALRIQIWDREVRQLRLRQQRRSSGQLRIWKVGTLYPQELR
ncbi:MAG: hypothetical protein ACYST0_06630 [Planctomycetota bacterium]